VILVGAGANPDAADADGMTALQFAATRGNHLLIETLCDLGADPNHHAMASFSPIFFAAAHGNTTAVEVLLKKGVLADTSGPNGKFPLQVAINEQVGCGRRQPAFTHIFSIFLPAMRCWRPELILTGLTIMELRRYPMLSANPRSIAFSIYWNMELVCTTTHFTPPFA
jgi:ankyrin repeat protein